MSGIINVNMYISYPLLSNVFIHPKVKNKPNLHMKPGGIIQFGDFEGVLQQKNENNSWKIVVKFSCIKEISLLLLSELHLAKNKYNEIGNSNLSKIQKLQSDFYLLRYYLINNLFIELTRIKDISNVS